jgi:hypothetical protein
MRPSPPYSVVTQLLVMCLLCCSCWRQHGATCRSGDFKLTSGEKYEIVIDRIDSLPSPLVLISKIDDTSSGNNFDSMITHDALYVEGKVVSRKDLDHVFYKEKGIVMTRPIENSGVWSPFYDSKWPTGCASE